jgi:hypothetical protein
MRGSPDKGRGGVWGELPREEEARFGGGRNFPKNTQNISILTNFINEVDLAAFGKRLRSLAAEGSGSPYYIREYAITH